MLARFLAWLRRELDTPIVHGPPPPPERPAHECHYHPTGAPWEAPSKWCAEMRVLKVNGRCCMCEATAVGIEVQSGKRIFGLWERKRGA